MKDDRGLEIFFPEWVTKFQVRDWTTGMLVAEFDSPEAREAWVKENTRICSGPRGRKYAYLVRDGKIDFNACILYVEV